MKTFKAAIIGCGAIFPMHAQALRAIGVDVAAVCDIVPERAEAKGTAFSCPAFTDYKNMLDGGGFDTVHICLPHYLHAEAAIYAAEHKMHVLTEKPMAIHLAEAQKMIAVAQANGVFLGVIFQNRYNPGSRLIKNTLASGELGRIRSGRIGVYWHRSGDYYTNSGWRGRWETEGGGVIINQSIHTFDLINWLMDSPAVFADASIANRNHPMVEVEDVAEGIIGYESGAIVSFYVTINNAYDAPVELEMCCENGMVYLTGEKAVIRFNDGREMSADRNPNEILTYGGGNKNYWGVSHIKQIQHFYQSLTQGKEPEINGAAALKTQRLINAIYDSGQTRRRVSI